MNVVSLFAGAGGFDLGFKRAGYQTALACDIWDLATKTLETNEISSRVVLADARDLKFKRMLNRHPDVIIGGPPCPAFSKSRFYRKEKDRGLEDSDGRLLHEYIRSLDELKPTAFVFENVHGFVYKPHARALETLTREVSKLGYKYSYRVVNAADYGVPQIRERFICVGVRKGLENFLWPETTHAHGQKSITDGEPQLGLRWEVNRVPQRWATAGEAIGDLDVDLPGDEDLRAGSKHKHLLPLIPPGQNYLYFTKERGHPAPLFRWRSRYVVRAWHGLASPEPPSL